jgi:hypothetical protein
MVERCISFSRKNQGIIRLKPLNLELIAFLQLKQEAIQNNAFANSLIFARNLNYYNPEMRKDG